MDSAKLVDQDVYLRCEANVNFMTRVGERWKAYRLEPPMDDAKVMHVVQASRNLRQLSSRGIRGSMSSRKRVYKARDEYQLQPPHVGFIPQVLLEVEAIHVLVDETEGVSLSRVHPHEW